VCVLFLVFGPRGRNCAARIKPLNEKPLPRSRLPFSIQAADLTALLDFAVYVEIGLLGGKSQGGKSRRSVDRPNVTLAVIGVGNDAAHKLSSLD
jgi:hypothetical protein